MPVVFAISRHNVVVFHLTTTLFLKVKHSYMFWLAKVANLRLNIQKMLPLSQIHKVPKNRIRAFFL